MNQHSVLRISQRSVRISTGIWNHKVLENNSLFSKAGNWFLVKQYDERQFLPKHSTWKYENDLQEHLKYKIRYRFIYFFSYGKNRMYSYCINHKLWRRYFFLFCSELDNNCEYAFYWKIFHFPPSNPPTVYASSFTSSLIQSQHKIYQGEYVFGLSITEITGALDTADVAALHWSHPYWAKTKSNNWWHTATHS